MDGKLTYLSTYSPCLKLSCTAVKKVNVRMYPVKYLRMTCDPLKGSLYYDVLVAKKCTYLCKFEFWVGTLCCCCFSTSKGNRMSFNSILRTRIQSRRLLWQCLLEGQTTSSFSYLHSSSFFADSYPPNLFHWVCRQLRNIRLQSTGSARVWDFMITPHYSKHVQLHLRFIRYLSSIHGLQNLTKLVSTDIPFY